MLFIRRSAVPLRFPLRIYASSPGKFDIVNHKKTVTWGYVLLNVKVVDKHVPNKGYAPNKDYKATPSVCCTWYVCNPKTPSFSKRVWFTVIVYSKMYGVMQKALRSIVLIVETHCLEFILPSVAFPHLNSAFLMPISVLHALDAILIAHDLRPIFRCSIFFALSCFYLLPLY